MTPEEFGDPVATAEFQKVDKKPQSVECQEPVTGRFVRVRILSEVNGNPWASAAEIGIVGTKAAN
jgi:hypothetical protein